MLTPRKLAAFHSHILGEPNSGCHLWMGTLSEKGYGKLGNLRAHRISWEINNGNIPDGICVLHKCDTPACVNPAHLFLGTHGDNSADKVRKGRQRGPGMGSAHKLAKLCEAQVIAIRHDDRRAEIIAAEYGIKKRNVFRIKAREGWRHI